MRLDAAPPPRPFARWLVVALLAAGVVAGAAGLAFLCDDAFITFRHVANARAGHGLVWNAPPFEPVEGYTGFAWAMLLWGVWAVFGAAPPAAANVLSVALGVATFGLVAAALLRVRDRSGAPLAFPAFVAALLALAGNRTFLQWLTGGLETALFNLAFVGWVVLAFRALERRDGRWLAAWAGLAALAALTRPDGLLLVAATAATAGVDTLRTRRWRQTAIALTPLLAVLLHVAWRRAFYGEWLPNTYFAKVTAPWPDAGWRYLYCFAFEHGAWWWALGAAAWSAVALRRGALAPRQLVVTRLPAVAAVTATLAQVGYYTLRVGGDHFEYRVFSHLVPLGVLSLAAMAAWCSARPALPLLACGGLALAGGVGWLHLALVPPAQPPHYVSFASCLPAWARPLVREYDRHQLWLQLQFVGMRCAWHAAALATNARLYHRDGEAAPDLWKPWRTPVDVDDLPVIRSPVVGLVAWKLPDVHVIDQLGLCDRVAARTPLLAWSAPIPPAAVPLVRAAADGDGDGFCTVDELAAAFRSGAGLAHGVDALLAQHMVMLFARERDGGLTLAEADRMAPFFAGYRWMAHERRAPEEYLAALDANVTLENFTAVVRPRATPLTVARVRAIEAEWWARVRER
jgi:arabinofuranosyltransferase